MAFLEKDKTEKDKKRKEDDSEWDKRKIGIFLIVLFLLFGLGFYLRGVFLPATTEDVKSASVAPKTTKDITDTLSSDVPTNMQDKVNQIQQSVNNLNVNDIASSSPQVQKVLNDIRALQDYPKNQAKQACINICNQL